MKKKFTFLIAAIAAILMMAQPVKAVGQTRDKITSYANIVSGTSYYIGATTGNTDYYLSVDGSTTTTTGRPGTAVTSMGEATPFIFAGSGTTWTIQFDDEQGYYLSLHTSKENGKVRVVNNSVNFTASNQNSLLRLTKGSYSIQKNNSGTQFGSYANTVTDIWLIEVPSGYTVAYDCNGGTTDCPEDATNIASGTSITLADAPSRPFFSFTGWNDGSQTYAAGDPYTVTDNVTMTAQWTLDEGELVTLTESNLELTGSYSSGVSVTIGDITYVHTDLMKSNGKIQAKASSGTIKNSTAYSGNILGVIITHDGTANSTTIWGSDNGDDWTSIETGSGSITADFSELQDKYQYFKITRGSGAAYWTKIEVIYAPSTDPIIVASDPEEALAYNATGGEFDYSITNPTSATLSAVSNSEWITNVAVDGTNSKVTFSTSTNTAFTQRQGTITLSYTGATDKVITITQNAAPAPSINAEDVDISGDATNGSIAYTISNPVSGGVLTAYTTSTWLTPGVVTNEAVPFTCEANQGVARSATVVLTYTYNTNQTVTENVTVTQAAAPYTTIPAMFAGATSSNQTVDVTFNNWVVSGVSTNGKNVFVTDNQGNGFVINSSTDQSGTYAVGNILSGTASSCTLKLNNGYAQLTNVSGLTINTGGTVTVSNIALADLSGVHTGALVSYNNLACSVSNTTYTLTDGATTIQLYTSLYNYTTTPDLVDGKTYNITGIYQQYSGTKEILPRSAADIEIKADLDTDTDFSSLTAFAYVLGHGPSEAQTVDIYCYDLEENTLRATAPANFEVSLTGDDDDYSPSVDMTPDDGDVSGTLYIRLAAGKDAGDYGGNLVFTAANLDTKNVALTGSVTTNPTYAITLVQPEQATISDNDVELAEAGTIITLSYTDLDDCYNFSDWSVYKTGEQSMTVTVNENQFTMPAYPVTATATFTQKTYTLDYYVNGSVVEVAGWHQNSVNCGTEVTLKTASDVTSAGITIPTGFTFAGWSTSANSTTTVSSVEVTANTTLYAVLAPTGVSADYVKVTEDLDNWSGEYLIVYEDGLVAFDGGRDNSTDHKIDASSNTIDITNYLDNGVIESNNTTDAAIFTISAITGGYSIQSASGYYIGSDSHNNELDVNANTAYANSLSIDDDENAVIIGFYESSSSYTALRYNASSNQNRFRYYKEAGQQAIQLYKKQTATPYTRVFTSTTTAPADITIEGPTLIAKDAVLDMGEYILSNSNAANLVIEDGGQLKFTSTGSKADVKATVQKDITGYGEESDKWNFIASPVTSNILITNVTNLLGEQIDNDPVTYNYDLYRLGGRIEDSDRQDWENYHEHNGDAVNPFESLVNGQGYLYAKQANTTLSFAGTIKPYDANYEIPVSEGWNLIGNPYTFDAYASVPYYAMNAEGTGITANTVTTSTAVKPCTGIIIKAAGDGNVKFLDEAPVGSANNSNLQITLAHNVTSRDGASVNSTLDNAIVSFNEGTKLQKFYFGEPAANIFIPQNGEDYAIAFSNRQGDMPLNFKTTEAGMYTISFEGDNMDLKGVCLIDMLAEEEIDLSVDPSYTFIGSPADKAERFKIVFRGFFDGASDEIFAFQSGSDIIVSGEGELQIFDVMGRKVKTQYVSGVQTVNVNAQGVYIMKLNEKTQKIIVR